MAAQSVVDRFVRLCRQMREDARLNLFGKAVCGKVAISVDKLKQPTKVTRSSDGSTFIAITTRTHAYKFSLFPVQFVNRTHSHPIRS